MSALIMRAYYFAFFAKIGVVVPYLPLYYQSLGLTPLQIGMLTSIMPLGRPLFAGAWTLPADRLGLRHAATVLSCWLAAGAFALYLIPVTFGGLAVVTLIVAATHAPIHALVEATVLDETRRREISYGRVRVWGSVGFVAASGLLGVALAYLPVRSVLWAAILLAAAVAVISLFLPRPATGPPRARTSLRGFLSRPGVAPFYIASMLMQASHGAYYTFYSIHMAAQGHASPVIGGLWAVGVISEMVVMVASARLLSLVRSSALLKSCFLLAGLRWAIYAVSGSLWLAIPAQILHAFTFGAFHLAAVTATHRIFPEDLRASGQAIYSGLTFGLGTVLGAMTAGALYDVIGPFRLYAVSALVALAGAVLMGRATRRIQGIDVPTSSPASASEEV
jgi:PPP family 3-phenylpropionic acid transporter